MKVSESIVQDFKAIEQAMPHMQKKTLEPADLTTLNNTKNTLKTAHAKAIFDKVLKKKQIQMN